MPLFSFGYSHCAPNRYVRLSTRHEMTAHFSAYWSIEYPDTKEEIEKMHRYAMKEITLEDATKAFIKWRADIITDKVQQAIKKLKFYEDEPASDEKQEARAEAISDIGQCNTEIFWLTARAEQYSLALPKPTDIFQYQN